MLGVIAIREGDVRSATAAIRRAAAAALPVGPTGGSSYYAPCGGLALHAWSNEGDDAPIDTWEGGARTCTGYRLGDDPATAGGLFLDFALDASARTLTVANCVTRIEACYWTQTADWLVVSNRALLVHLFAQGSDVPDYAPANLASFLCMGYFADDLTPFRGVNVLPPNMKWVAAPGREPVCRALDDTLGEAYGQRSPDTAFSEAFAQALIDSCAPLRNRWGVTAAVTGGKDSRLIVAALKAAGIDCSTETAGFETNPDVIVGARVAAALGLPHRVLSPKIKESKDRAVLTVDPLARTVSTLRVSDGMMSGYENVPTPGPFKPDDVNVGGHGGELVRGGYAKNVASHEYVDLIRFWRRVLVGPGRTLLTQDAHRAYTDRLDGWLVRQPEELKPIDLLDKFYLEYRCGRWSATARSAYTLRRALVQPFFDNRVVKLAQQATAEARLKDRVMYGALRLLAPDTVDDPVRQ